MTNLAMLLETYRSFPGSNLISVPIDVNAVAWWYYRVCLLQPLAVYVRVSPVSSSHDRAIEWSLYQHSHKVIPTVEDRNVPKCFIYIYI